MGVQGRDEPDRRAAGIRVLEVQPDLAEGLDAEQAALAHRHAVAALETVEPGPWTPAFEATPGSIGLLVIDGVLTREVRMGGRWASELLGPGDLLRPWDHDDGEDASIETPSAWTVLARTRLAVLDERFGRIVGRWPEVTAGLLSRTIRRARWMAIMLAISNLTRVDERVIAVMWHLADRWGHVTPEGVVVPVPLTHEMIGKLVGAHRPSVTSALGDLQKRGTLTRSEDGWVLHGEPPRLDPNVMSGRIRDRAQAAIDPGFAAALMPFANVLG
jgi:CRP/FNR family transcriptional regulator, cyclic AMP receptor protein